MALVTANQFRLTPDIAGGVSRGLQLGGQIRQFQQGLKQAELQPQIQQLRQRALGGDQTALTQLAGIAPEQAQQVQQFQSGQATSEQQSQDRRVKSVVEGALRLQNLPDDASRLSAAKARRAKILSENIPSTNTVDTDEIIQLFESGQFDQANALIASAVKAGRDLKILKAEPVTKPAAGFTLSPGQQRFGPGGERIAQVAPRAEARTAEAAQAVIPGVLLEGLDPEISAKGAAAFQAAGGGKDGLTAFQKIVDKGTEQQRRLASPAILKSNFPQASKAEQAQLQGVMDAAKTTESGLKSAQKVRSEQKRLKKAAVFQDRAVELLDRILASGDGILGGDLGDVLGSIEGAIDVRFFSDDEAQVISDIEEAVNILTAGNLDLMTGVLSETDIKIISNLAGGALNRKRTKERFVKDVTELRDRLASQKVVTIDDRDAAQGPSEGATATGPNGEKIVFTNGKWAAQNG
jgi:hypothetical protein